MGYKKLAMPLLFINTIAIAKMDAQVQQILYPNLILKAKQILLGQQQLTEHQKKILLLR